MFEQLKGFISLFEQSALIMAIISILFLMTGIIVAYDKRKYSQMIQKEKSRNRRNESILRSRMVLMESVLNQLSEPVAYRNGRGEFEWVNREMAALWGLSVGRVIKSRPEDLFPGWAEELKNIETSLRSQNRPLIKEKKITHPGGELKSYEITYKMIDEAGGDGKGLLFQYKDISRYREKMVILNDLYISVREDLQQRSDYYADFLRWGMPPLHTIMEECERLLQKHDLDNDTKNRVDIIAASGRDMSSYMRNLSFLAFPDKISAMYENDEEAPEDVSRSLENWQNLLVDRVKTLRAEKNMPVFVLLQGDIPEALNARFSLLNELLERLIENADAYSRGGYYLIIRVNRVEAGFFTMNITVRNSGPAIEASRREDIFKPFTRIISEKPGSGLGLTVARSLAEKMGGSLSCDPSCRDGARFLLSLPPVRGQGTVISGSRLEGIPSEGTRSLLLADSDSHFIQKLAGQFARAGFSVDMAGSQAETQERMTRESYFLVLADREILLGSEIPELWLNGQFPGTENLCCLSPLDETLPALKALSAQLPVFEKPVAWNQILDLIISEGEGSGSAGGE